MTDGSCVYKLTEIFTRITLLPVRSLCALAQHAISVGAPVRRRVYSHSTPRIQWRHDGRRTIPVSGDQRVESIQVIITYGYSKVIVVIIRLTAYAYSVHVSGRLSGTKRAYLRNNNKIILLFTGYPRSTIAPPR